MSIQKKWNLVMDALNEVVNKISGTFVLIKGNKIGEKYFRQNIFMNSYNPCAF